jgi:alanine-synthesizing transaminase
LRALLAADEEVLVPSPDYPLWTAAVNLNRGRAVHYPCRPEHDSCPTRRDRGTDHKRTRAIVVINPNNPTGAVYPRGVLEAIARIAEKHHLVVCRDEIYDQMTYDGAEFVPHGDPRAPHALRDDERLVEGLSGAAAIAVGWAASPATSENSREYLSALESALVDCACAATWPGSGPCRPRSAVTRASASS